MPIEQVKQIIGRAVTDAAFREALLNDPEASLAGYDLTAEERKALEGLTEGTFNAANSELDSRISRVGVGGILGFDPIQTQNEPSPDWDPIEKPAEFLKEVGGDLDGSEDIIGTAGPSK